MTETFFLLLRSGLYGMEIGAEKLPRQIVWEDILDIAKKQTVMGVIADAVMRLPEAAKPPKEIQEKLQAFSKQNVFTHLLLNKTLAATVALMSENGIRSVLLKGQGIARCYRTPEMRQCGDIDLYIGEENYAKACALAKEKLHDGEKDPTESTKHYGLMHGGVSIELHRKSAEMFLPWRNARLRRWEKEQFADSSQFRNAEFFGVNVYLPPVNFDALFIFIHLQHHFLYGGIGLRQLCDWTMLLHKYKDEIDREKLGEMLGQLGLLKLWQIMGHIAVNQLGLPEKEMPFYSTEIEKDSALALRSIMDGGNFGRYSSNLHRKKFGYHFVIRKMISFWEHTCDFPRKFRYSPLEMTFSYFHTFFYGIYVLIVDLFKSPKKA